MQAAHTIKHITAYWEKKREIFPFSGAKSTSLAMFMQERKKISSNIYRLVMVVLAAKETLVESKFTAGICGGGARNLKL